MRTTADLLQGRLTRRPAGAALRAALRSAVLAALAMPLLPSAAGAAVPGDASEKIARPAGIASPPRLVPPGLVPRGGDAAADRPKPGTIAAAATPSGPELAVVLARPAPAAAFRYGNHVWIVVATTEPLSRPSAGGAGPRPFADLEVTRLDGAVALRIAHRAGRRLEARRTGSTWRFTHVEADASVAGRAPSLRPAVRSASLEGVVVAVADARLSTVHRLVDPVVGATLIVTTSSGPEAAMRFAFRAIPFRLLPTELGMAVEVRADGVDVERDETGIRIRYRRPAAPPPER